MIYLLVGSGLVALVFLFWGLASRRRSLPCPTWLAWMVERDNPFTATNRAEVILGRLGIKAGMTVADIGCGPGRLTIPAARQVGGDGLVLAMDVQPGMLRRVEEKAQAARLGNIRLLHAGAGDGQLGRNRFHRALLVTVLGEIPDRQAALREVFEALRPGGILSVTELIFDPHFQRRATVIRLATEAGFRHKASFGGALAYSLHFEKPEACRQDYLGAPSSA